MLKTDVPQLPPVIKWAGNKFSHQVIYRAGNIFNQNHLASEIFKKLATNISYNSKTTLKNLKPEKNKVLENLVNRTGSFLASKEKLVLVSKLSR